MLLFNMKYQVFYLLLIITLFSYGQKENSIYPNFIGKSFSEITKDSDWNILKEASGDLNNDKLDDIVMVLESKDSIPEKRCNYCKLLKNKPRIILVLLNTKGTQRVIIQNNKFIARGDEGGMSTYIEPEISIEKNLLTIYYQFTRTNQSYTFEFNNNKMFIAKGKGIGVHSASGDFESHVVDFKTKNITIETGNISEEYSKMKEIKLTAEPKCLSEFKKMYDWEVEKNIYL